MPETLSIALVLDKETPGTYRYAAADSASPITTLYIRKLAFTDHHPPKLVVLTVEYSK